MFVCLLFSTSFFCCCVFFGALSLSVSLPFFRTYPRAHAEVFVCLCEHIFVLSWVYSTKRKGGVNCYPPICVNKQTTVEQFWMLACVWVRVRVCVWDECAKASHCFVCSVCFSLLSASSLIRSHAICSCRSIAYMQGARRLVIFLWIGCCWIEPIVRQYANSSSSRRCSTTNNRKEYTWSTALNKTMFWVKGNNFWTQSLCSYMDIAVWNLSKNWESLCRCFFCLSFLLLLQNLFSFHLFAYVYSIASPQYMPQHILGTYLLLFFTVFSFLPCSTIYYISDCIIPPYLILACVCVCVWCSCPFRTNTFVWRIFRLRRNENERDQ